MPLPTPPSTRQSRTSASKTSYAKSPSAKSSPARSAPPTSGQPKSATPKTEAPKQRNASIVEKIESYKNAPPYLLILAPETIRRQRVLAAIHQRFFKDSASSEVPHFRGNELDSKHLRSLQDALCSLSLFTKEQLFVIDDIQDCNAELQKQILSILENLGASTTVVVTGTKLPSNSTFLRFFERNEAIISLPELEGVELKRWAEKELRNAGILKTDPRALELLLRLATNQADTLFKLIEHVSLYCENGELSLDTLNQLFVERIEPSEFELVDALQSKNPAKPEILLYQIVKSGKNLFGLLALIARVYNNYLLIKLLQKRGLNSTEIRDRLGQTPWVFNKTVSGARHYSLQTLLDIQGLVLRADSKLKNKSLGPDLVLSELVGKICGAGR